MPIHIDLLAEDHEAEEVRRRDPVKRVGIVSGFIVLLVIAYCASLQLKLMRMGGEIKAQQSLWNQQEEAYNIATENLREVAVFEQSLSALYRYSTNRFLWAPVLNALQYGEVKDVRITRLRSRQVFTFTAEVKNKRDGKITTPAQSVESISLWLEARDESPEAGSQVNTYRETIGALPFFAENLEAVNGIRLTDLTPPQTNPLKPGREFVLFTLECNFPERLREAKP